MAYKCLSIDWEQDSAKAWLTVAGSNYKFSQDESESLREGQRNNRVFFVFLIPCPLSIHLDLRLDSVCPHFLILNIITLMQTMASTLFQLAFMNAHLYPKTGQHWQPEEDAKPRKLMLMVNIGKRLTSSQEDVPKLRQALLPTTRLQDTWYPGIE